MDGAMTKAPSGRRADRQESHGPGKLGAKRSLLTEANGVPVGLARISHQGMESGWPRVS